MSDKTPIQSSLDQASYERTTATINRVMEPRIQTLINEFNKIMNLEGVMVGVELTWFITKHEEGKSDG